MVLLFDECHVAALFEDDELGVLDRRLAAFVAGKADARSEPGQSRITVDDVREQADSAEDVSPPLTPTGD